MDKDCSCWHVVFTYFFASKKCQVGGAQLLGGSCGQLLEAGEQCLVLFAVGTPFYSYRLLIMTHDDDNDEDEEDEDDGDDEDEDDDHDLSLNPCSATEVPIHWVHAFEHHRRNGSSLDG